MKTKIGQIFLEHPKDQNFSTLYEESFSKHGNPLEIFAVIEIADPKSGRRAVKNEYEKIAQILVTALKRTYVTSPALDEDTFERALGAVNASLSRSLGRGKTSWYGNLHAAVGVLSGHDLCLSATGSAIVYLARRGELINLSENLTLGAARPVKIFSNFSTGRVAAGDRVVFSTNELFNYLSLERIQEFLGQELDEACREIIAALTDIKTVSFAAFILEINGRASPSAEKGIDYAQEQPVAARKAGGGAAGEILKIAWGIATSIFLTIWLILRKIGRSRQKKYIVFALTIAVVFLAANLGRAAWQKSARQKENRQQNLTANIEDKLNQGEAALIYKDEDKVISFVTEAENLLAELKNIKSPQYDAMEQRLAVLKDKVNKEVHIDNPTVLAQFPNIPTDLLQSPNGFLGYNRSSSSFAFYDFRLGETKTILQGQNTGNLLVGGYVGAVAPYVFLNRDGKFTKLDTATQILAAYETENANIDLGAAQISALKVFGEGEGARVYLLDSAGNKIWRLRVRETEIAPAESWLKSESADFGSAVDFAVDGSIFVLFPERVEKYFSGEKQNFELSAVAPALKQATKIFTLAEYQSLYVADPANSRILVFNKTGRLEKQIISEKFRDLSDIYIDEKNGLLYALTGSELLRVTLP